MRYLCKSLVICALLSAFGCEGEQESNDNPTQQPAPQTTATPPGTKPLPSPTPGATPGTTPGSTPGTSTNAPSNSAPADALDLILASTTPADLQWIAGYRPADEATALSRTMPDEAFYSFSGAWEIKTLSCFMKNNSGVRSTLNTSYVDLGKSGFFSKKLSLNEVQSADFGWTDSNNALVWTESKTAWSAVQSTDSEIRARLVYSFSANNQTQMARVLFSFDKKHDRVLYQIQKNKLYNCPNELAYFLYQ